MRAPTCVSLEAPAKINLGLEILGKRPDGYHEIRTIMAMISLTDTLTVGIPEVISGNDVAGVPHGDNLVTQALSAHQALARSPRSLTWSIQKRIPAAAGLGGASSDAAAALRAANTLDPCPLDDESLLTIAAGIGSDVPFFLQGPAGIATGRGETIRPLEAQALDLLLMVPRISIPGKTRLLYSFLTPGDFSDGSRSEDLARSLASGARPSAEALGNAFCRALRSHVPAVGELQRYLEQAAGGPWGLSGAGPAHYVILPLGEHSALAAGLDRRFPGWLDLHSVRTLSALPIVRHPKAGATSERV